MYWPGQLTERYEEKEQKPTTSKRAKPDLGEENGSGNAQDKTQRQGELKGIINETPSLPLSV